MSTAENTKDTAQPEDSNGTLGSSSDKQADSHKHTLPKPAELKEKLHKKDEDKGPAGGYDDTPIPKRPAGWTVKFTFLRADNLPMADINTLSSDPYVAAELITDLPQRHKEDPPLRFRTQTIRKDTDPTWNNEWIVANVPSSGFKMKARLYDEDPADHDDRLGNAHIHVDKIDAKWPGIKNQAYNIKKRMGSKRAYLVRAVATCVGATKHMNGQLYMSVELLGRTQDDNGGRMYTIGPSWWIKHYSPMLGRLTGMKEDDEENKAKQAGSSDAEDKADGSQNGNKPRRKSTQRYNFQANQVQLPGPVPAELYHRYVEFKPFVQGMFTHSGVRGFLLNKALHHQHARVYNFDRSTLWGNIPTDDTQALTRRFLELVHYDKGGKIFTYVLTLDAVMRFTETGKEFGIDMLSKHTMHSDVEIYIAFSGEFFIRRHRSRNRGASTGSAMRPESKQTSGQGFDTSKPVAGEEVQESTDNDDPDATEGGEVGTTQPVAAETEEEGVSLDPSNYELIIDNDSGTYRPANHLLPLLRLFLQRSFPGLHVRVLDCQADEEKMNKLKQEQRDRKRAEAGGDIVYAQRDRSDSISSQSSSDESDLDAVQAGGERHLHKQIFQDAQWRAGAKMKKLDPRHKRAPDDEANEEDEEGQASSAQQQPSDGAKHADGPSEPTEAERIAKDRGHEYDPAKDPGAVGQGQSIGQALQKEMTRHDEQ